MKKRLLITLPLMALLASCGNNVGSLANDGKELTDETQKQEILRYYSDIVDDLKGKDILEYSGNFALKATNTLKVKEGEPSQKLNIDLSFKYDLVQNTANTLPTIEGGGININLPSYALKVENFNLKVDIQVEFLDFKVDPAIQISDLTFGTYFNGANKNLYLDLSDPSVNSNLDSIVSVLGHIPGLKSKLPKKGTTLEEVYDTNKLLFNLGSEINLEEILNIDAIPAIRVRADLPIVIFAPVVVADSDVIFDKGGVAVIAFNDGDEYAIKVDEDKSALDSLVKKYTGIILPENFDFSIDSVVSIAKDDRGLFKLQQIDETIVAIADLDNAKIDANYENHQKISAPSSVTYFGNFVSGVASDYSVPGRE